MKPGKTLTIAGKGAFGFSLSVTPNPVDVVLTLGNLHYCLSFGGEVRVREGRRYLATNAAAPPACP